MSTSLPQPSLAPRLHPAVASAHLPAHLNLSAASSTGMRTARRRVAGCDRDAEWGESPGARLHGCSLRFVGAEDHVLGRGPWEDLQAVAGDDARHGIEVGTHDGRGDAAAVAPVSQVPELLRVARY